MFRPLVFLAIETTRRRLPLTKTSTRRLPRPPSGAARACGRGEIRLLLQLGRASRPVSAAWASLTS